MSNTAIKLTVIRWFDTYHILNKIFNTKNKCCGPTLQYMKRYKFAKRYISIWPFNMNVWTQKPPNLLQSHKYQIKQTLAWSYNLCDGSVSFIVFIKSDNQIPWFTRYLSLTFIPWIIIYADFSTAPHHHELMDRCMSYTTPRVFAHVSV